MFFRKDVYFSINGRFCLVSLGNPTFSNIFPVPDTFWWLLNYERYVNIHVSFRVYFFFVCHLSKHAFAMLTILISKSWWWLLKPWCNGYRRRKWTRRHEFKSWTRLIAFHIALILLGKVWILLFSLQLWVNSRAE